MKIDLTQISPVAFLLISEGDKGEVRKVSPKTGEYRGNIGSPKASMLVFKDDTKIGMIPHEVIIKHGIDSIETTCVIVSIDKENNIISVEM